MLHKSNENETENIFELCLSEINTKKNNFHSPILTFLEADKN